MLHTETYKKSVRDAFELSSIDQALSKYTVHKAELFVGWMNGKHSV